MASEDIFNPVVRRSVRISFKILNALMKKYGTLDEVVIEMPRDRNSDEQKKWEKETQKRTKKNRSILKINWLQYMISDFHRLISLRKSN